MTRTPRASISTGSLSDSGPEKTVPGNGRLSVPPESLCCLVTVIFTLPLAVILFPPGVSRVEVSFVPDLVRFDLDGHSLDVGFAARGHSLPPLVDIDLGSFGNLEFSLRIELLTHRVRLVFGKAVVHEVAPAEQSVLEGACDEPYSGQNKAPAEYSKFSKLAEIIEPGIPTAG